MTDEKIVYVSNDNVGPFNITDDNKNSTQTIINKAIKHAFDNKYTTVHIKSGVYVINNPIEIYSGITLEGDGAGKTIIKLIDNAALNTKSLFYIAPNMRNPAHGADTIMVPLIWAVGSTANKCAGANNVIFKDFENDVNYDNNAQIRLGRGYFNGVQLYNSKNVEVYNIYMHDGHGDGVRVVNSANVKVHDCKFRKLGHDAVFCIRSDNCHSYNNTVAIRTNSGGRMNDCTNSSIHDNEVWCWNPKDWTAGGPGFQIERQYKAEISVEVYNNIVHDVFGCGIWAARNKKAIAESGKSKVNIHDNIFYNCGLNYSIDYQGGIVIDGIHNVYFQNNVVDKCYGHGVVVMGMTDTTNAVVKTTTYVKNNIIINTLKRLYNPSGTGYGIHNRYSSSCTIVSSNNCLYNNITGNYKNVKSTGDIITDPLCVDSTNHNYSFKSNSPCIKTKIGLTKSLDNYNDTNDIPEKSNVIKTIYPLYNNRLKENAPETVVKSDTFVDVGGLNSKKYRSVVYFDLSDYNNFKIIKATLSLFWYYPDGTKRTNNTILEVYRPLPYTSAAVTWNTRKQNIKWAHGGGDWFDKNGATNGSVPFSSFVINKDVVPTNSYYNLDVTELIQKYLNGTFTNTGFLLKAKDEKDNYIAFYNGSIVKSNKKLKLTIEYIE